MPDRLGPFEVVRTLGEGGMGVVYEVRDSRSGRTCALKLIRQGAGGADGLARFQREAEALGRVLHPGLVRVEEVGRLPQGPYLLMELVGGVTLEERLRAGPLPVDEAVRIVGRLCEALGLLHERGIVHRDVKPANVMLRSDGSPVLLDFGLARSLDADRLTQTGAPVGTPEYMSPEQANGVRELTAACDVYGLGVLLYTLLCGRPPFAGTTFKVIRSVLEETPKWPGEVRPEVPEWVDAAVRAAMSKRPGDRPQSAGALRDLLAARAPRRSASALLVVGLVGAAGLFLAGAVAQTLQAGPSRPPEQLPPTPAPQPPEDPLPPPEPKVSPPVSPPDDSDLLWRLTAGEQFTLRFGFEDSDLKLRYAIGGDLSMKVQERQGDEWLLLARVAAFRGRVGPLGMNLDLASEFDTATARPGDAAHPYECLKGGVGRTFQVRLAAKDGATRCLGVADVRVPVLRALGATRMDESRRESVRRICRETLSDGYIGKAMTTLFQTGGAFTWARSRSGEETSKRESSPLVGLTPTWSGWAQLWRDGEGGKRDNPPLNSRETRFDYVGRRRFRDGRLANAELTQTLVEVDGLRSGLPKLVAKWSAEILPP
jgi:serine/threonine protein kinase